MVPGGCLRQVSLYCIYNCTFYSQCLERPLEAVQWSATIGEAKGEGQGTKQFLWYQPNSWGQWWCTVLTESQTEETGGAVAKGGSPRCAFQVGVVYACNTIYKSQNLSTICVSPQDFQDNPGEGDGWWDQHREAHPLCVSHIHFAGLYIHS